MSVFDTVSSMQWNSTQAFRGADLNRLRADRWVHANDPDNEVRYAARPLRAAARDLVRNNPYAAGAVEAAADNIIGRRGIVPVPKYRGPDGELDRSAIDEIRRGWSEWGDRYASIDGVESWCEIERLLIKGWFTDGEVFIRHRRGWDNPYGYAVELIDPDLLDESFNETREQNGREIVMGVELDEFERPAAYHFWRHHPDDMRHPRGGRVRIPADEIVHFFVRYRVGQTRGFSLFAPILTTVEMIDGYTEAELVAARYAASKMGFLQATSQEAIAAWANRVGIENEGGKSPQNRRTKIAPGQLEELMPGWEFTGFDPTHPNDAFDPFLQALFRGVARGLHMSYITFSGDVGAANYSSMRAGLIPERDHWIILQDTVSRRVHRPVSRTQVAMGILAGGYDLPSSDPTDYEIDEWRGRRWDWVDPENDLKATEAEIKLGLTSRQRKAAERGHDYETVVEESQRDLEYAKERGVYVGGLNTPANTGRSNSSDDDPNGNGNGAGRPRSRLKPYPIGP